jgi:alpha-glucosidase
MIYLDIDYMDRYMDFTVDGEKFPDFPQFVEKMAHKGIHLVPIIDAGIKVQEGYGVYEEGVEKGYFCKDEEGRDFVGAVWPGAFPRYAAGRGAQVVWRKI